jgi:hypothetical protein
MTLESALTEDSLADQQGKYAIIDCADPQLETLQSTCNFSRNMAVRTLSICLLGH